MFKLSRLETSQIVAPPSIIKFVVIHGTPSNSQPVIERTNFSKGFNFTLGELTTNDILN
jgi:hypothetical protein